MVVSAQDHRCLRCGRHERSAAVSTAWPGAEFKGQATSDALWTTPGSRPSAGGRRGFPRPSPPVTAQRCPFCPPRARAPPGAGSESPLPVHSHHAHVTEPQSQGCRDRPGLWRSSEVAGAALRFSRPGLTPLSTGPPSPVRWRRGHSRLRLQHGAQS